MFALTAIAAVLVHYYSVFNLLVDTRLRRAALGTPAIYARPLELRVGAQADATAWKWRLEATGYAVKQRSVAGGRRELQVGPHRGSRAARLIFQDDVLVTIVTGKEAVRELSLGPEFLSSMAGARLEKSRRLDLTEAPRRLKEAVLAAEDQRFFQHPGVDILTLARAALRNLWFWELGHGGSTLTQQLVKNYFLTPEKRIRRKLEEMLFALWLERRFTKEELLELYLNTTYLGQMGGFAIHGFGQASLSYFGKDLDALDLSETATLVGMVPAPNRYSPYRNPAAVLQRRDYVLERMEAEGYITASERAAAGRQDLVFRPASFQESSQAPYFVDLAADLLKRDYGLELSPGEDIAVHSTLDPALQHLAFQAIRQGTLRIRRLIGKRSPQPEPQAALIALDPSNGELLALIGGLDYAAGPFNRAVYAFRQPGSTLKPFVLAAALERPNGGSRLTLASRVLDEPYTFRHGGRDYSPRNYGSRYHGPVSLRHAVALSLNVPTVKLAEKVGFNRLLRSYRRFGLGDGWKPYPSLALGTFEVSLLQLAQAYQPLANQGKLIPLRATRRVIANGATLPEPNRPPRRALSPQVAFLVVSALQSVLDEGTGKSVRQHGFYLPAAGKTGTAEDAWFVGFTPELLCAVWVGTDGPPALGLDGSRAAIPIWTRFMLGARDAGYLSGREFSIPPGIQRVLIDEQTGLRAGPSCAEVREEFFLPGTAPTEYCREHDTRVEL